MSQSFWEAEVAEPPQAESAEPDSTQLEATEPKQPAAEPPAKPDTLALSMDDFSALEERVLRAVNLVKSARQAHAAAEERAAKAEAEFLGQVPVIDELQEEVRTLRAERENVRQRVERLLAQLDALEL
jgi:hypothetical protein